LEQVVSNKIDDVKEKIDEMMCACSHRALFAWACLADKPWLKVLLVDFV